MTRDINKIMPKIRGMKWGAVTNAYPTIQRLSELNRIFPHNGLWHEVYYGKDFNYIDGKRIPIKTLESMT